MVTFPEWRDQCRGVLHWMVIKRWLQQRWLLAQHQRKWALVQILPTIKDPEADGGLNDSLAPTDPVAPPMSVGRRQPNEPTETERLAHNRTHIPFADWCESCVRGRGRDDPHRARQGPCGGKPPFQSFNATISSSKQRRRTSCARQLARSIRYTTARWRWSVNSKV